MQKFLVPTVIFVMVALLVVLSLSGSINNVFERIKPKSVSKDMQAVINLLEQTERNVESRLISYDQLSERVTAMDSKYNECLASLDGRERSKASFQSMKSAIDDYRRSLTSWEQKIKAKANRDTGMQDVCDQMMKADWSFAKANTYQAKVQLKHGE